MRRLLWSDKEKLEIQGFDLRFPFTSIDPGGSGCAILWRKPRHVERIVYFEAEHGPWSLHPLGSLDLVCERPYVAKGRSGQDVVTMCRGLGFAQGIFVGRWNDFEYEEGRIIEVPPSSWYSALKLPSGVKGLAKKDATVAWAKTQTNLPPSVWEVLTKDRQRALADGLSIGLWWQSLKRRRPCGTTSIAD